MSKALAGSTGLETPENAAFNVRFGSAPPHRAMTSESGVPSSTSWTPGTRTSPTTVTITVPAESAVPVRPVPRGAAGEDVRCRRQRLDVVDERRVARLAGGGRRARLPAHRHGGQQAVLPRRQEPRQRIAALDDLQQRLLLAEQVLVRSFDDRDRQLAEQPGVTELDRGAAQVGGLDAERSLHADVRGRGVDAIGGDGETFDDPVRIGAHQGAVLERRRLTLGAVGHGVVGPSTGGAHRRPLRPSREAGASSPAQPAGRDLLDRRLRAERSGGPQPFPTAGSQVLVDRRDRRHRQEHVDLAHHDMLVRLSCWAIPCSPRTR